jgi:50S ribosomal subunit-associated GTPase HflX
LDGGKIPCLLVENKADLLGNDDENITELQDFSKEHDFCGCFRTSAKTGLNIDESMRLLISTIIQRMEAMQGSSDKEVFTTERKVVKLDENKVTQPKRKGGKDSCC